MPDGQSKLTILLLKFEHCIVIVILANIVVCYLNIFFLDFHKGIEIETGTLFRYLKFEFYFCHKSTAEDVF